MSSTDHFFITEEVKNILLQAASCLVRCQVLAASSMKDIAPCSLVEIDWRYRDAYRLHHQGDDSWLQVCTSYLANVVYVGHGGHFIETRVKEHHWNIRLGRPDTSTVADHSIDIGHQIQLHNVSILSTTHRPDDGVSKHLWNVCQLLRDYMTQYVRRQSSSAIVVTVLGQWNIQEES
jgi:hypothetical protein